MCIYKNIELLTYSVIWKDIQIRLSKTVEFHCVYHVCHVLLSLLSKLMLPWWWMWTLLSLTFLSLSPFLQVGSHKASICVKLNSIKVYRGIYHFIDFLSNEWMIIITWKPTRDYVVVCAIGIYSPGMGPKGSTLVRFPRHKKSKRKKNR